MTVPTLCDADLAVDRELASIAESFRFLLDLTPVNLLAARRQFEVDGRTPRFEYRPLEDDPAVAMKRLSDVRVDEVEDPTVASLLMAKQRELQLQLQMLSVRESDQFLGSSVELYGTVGPELAQQASDILSSVPPPPPEPGPWLDADDFVLAARAELDRYREVAPDIEAHVEIRQGSSGIMVSNGVLLIAPTTRVAASRVDGLLAHEVATHMLTYVNGAHQPLHVLATGLAGHDETQEGLAVLSEYLVGGLTPHRLRQLAARVVAVNEMLGGSAFPEVHRSLTGAGFDAAQAFTITMRVFRSGGLTKDAIYLRGLHDLVSHLVGERALEPLWLGKLPLHAVPLIEDLHQRGVLNDPLLLPRFLEDPVARSRLATVRHDSSLTSLLERAS